MIRIHGSNGSVELEVNSALTQYSTIDGTQTAGCFTLDDTPEARNTLKQGANCAIQSIELPEGVDAYPYYPDGSWNGVCRTNSEAVLPGNQTHSFQNRSPCAFRFVTTGESACVRRNDGLCNVHFDVSVTNMGQSMNDAFSQMQTISHNPCDYFACNDTIQNVIDTTLPKDYNMNVMQKPLPDFFSNICDRIPCKKIVESFLRSVPEAYIVCGGIVLLIVLNILTNIMVLLKK